MHSIIPSCLFSCLGSVVIGVRHADTESPRYLGYLSNCDSMQPFAAISLLFAVLVAAHGDHNDAGENAKLAGAEYAIRHVRLHESDFGPTSLF